jgi:hypothetical protein
MEVGFQLEHDKTCRAPKETRARTLYHVLFGLSVCMAVARVRQRSGTSFFITLTPVVYYESVRSDFLQYFDCVETYCVSIEGLNCNKVYHLYAYLCFKCLLNCTLANCIFFFTTFICKTF